MLKSLKKRALQLIVLTLFITQISCNSVLAQDIHSEKTIIAQRLVCPRGTSPDKEESTEAAEICDVDSDPTVDNAKDLDVYARPRKPKPYVVHEDDFPKLVNKSYPEWYRGHGEDGKADDDAFHYYYTLMGPGAPAPGYDTDNLFCSSFYLKPEKTYFAHNHPTNEIYYIIDGEAEWHAGDEVYNVRSGSFIVHPPYVAHGFTNTSKSRLLRAFGCWWRTPDQPDDILNYAGLPSNPCLAEKEETAQAGAVSPVCK